MVGSECPELTTQHGGQKLRENSFMVQVRGTVV